MTPFIPFVAGLIGAAITEFAGTNDEAKYGQTPRASVRLSTEQGAQRPRVSAVAIRELAPSRFTKGTALASIAKARTHKRDVTQPTQPEPGEEELGEETEVDEGEAGLDPLETVEQHIEQELLLNSIADEVLEDMDIGYDPDLEESLPTDEEFLAKYEPLDAPDEEYGGGHSDTHRRRRESFGSSGTRRRRREMYGTQSSIFAPGIGWGIRRRRT